jgi:hypothetical protein
VSALERQAHTQDQTDTCISIDTGTMLLLLTPPPSLSLALSCLVLVDVSQGQVHGQEAGEGHEESDDVKEDHHVVVVLVGFWLVVRGKGKRGWCGVCMCVWGVGVVCGCVGVCVIHRRRPSRCSSPGCFLGFGGGGEGVVGGKGKRGWCGVCMCVWGVGVVRGRRRGWFER